MEKMPFQEHAGVDTIVSTVPIAKSGLHRHDWRTGLPILTGSLVTLRELRLAAGGRSSLMRWWNDAFARVANGVQRIWLDERIELLTAFVLGVWGPLLALGVLAPHFSELGAWAALPVGVGWGGWLVTAWALPARLEAHPSQCQLEHRAVISATYVAMIRLQHRASRGQRTANGCPPRCART